MTTSESRSRPVRVQLALSGLPRSILKLAAGHRARKAVIPVGQHVKSASRHRRPLIPMAECSFPGNQSERRPAVLGPLCEFV